METTIINKDNMDYLRVQPAASVDFIFYDPPYNAKKKYDGYSDNQHPTLYKIDMMMVQRYCMGIARNGMAVYIPSKLISMFYAWMRDAHQIIVHKRAKGVVSNNYSLQYYAILSTAKPLIKTSDVWDDIRLPGEGYFFREPHLHKVNPGFTSLELTKRVIETFTKEGDTVLDPYMGIGTTGVACKLLNRNFIGIEQSMAYCFYAQERIAEATHETI